MSEPLRSTAQPGVRPRATVAAGGALLNLGFRPFYLLAAALAASALPLWVGQYAGWIVFPGYLTGVLWHAHEMVFGFAAAVITGFLFTAARNWTGLPTPTGRALAALAVLWVAGRILVVTGPTGLAILVDVAFLPLVAAALWLPLFRARNRNLFFAAILLLLGALNGAFHAGLAGVLAAAPLRFVEAATAVVVLIVAVMGGRVIPAFTANAIRTANVRRSEHLDRAALIALAFALCAYLFAVPAPVTAPACLIAAVLHAERLRRWDPLCTRRAPILWILHLSYAWIPVGLLLLGLFVVQVAATAALAFHAFGIGAIGGMIIGMMTRTARGHTGRPLVASRPEVIAYVLVPVAALVRVLLPLIWPAATLAGVVLAGALWSAAFAIYLAVYWTILTCARVDGKPG